MGDPLTDPFETRAPRWDSPGERARWLTRVASHVDALTKLLHVARRPLPPVMVAPLSCCGRCSYGPFEGLTCPECGDDDLRPAGETVRAVAPPQKPRRASKGKPTP